jgi:hypothetical protein
MYIDSNNRLITYGKNLAQASLSDEIIVIKGDIVPHASKVVIPSVSTRAKAKVVFQVKCCLRVSNRKIFMPLILVWIFYNS